MGPRFRMGRRRGLVVGAAVGAAAASRKKNNQPEDFGAQEAAAPIASSTDQQLADLEKLGQLKDQGILTQEEFEAKKKQILGT